MHPEREPVQRVVRGLVHHFGSAPPTALILGSGLGSLTERLEGSVSTSAKELGLPQSRVSGHAGMVVRGALGSSQVVVLSGRVHFYEGHSMQHIVRGVRAMHAWGVQRLIVTCATGGIADALTPGSLALITDHINFLGDTPLRGVPFGTVRFPDVSNAYDPQLRDVLARIAHEQGIVLNEGVYAAMMGPSYETPAEIRMLRAMGADMVGMSTVPEVLAASALGLRVAAVAMVSNRAAGLAGSILDHGDVTETARRAAGDLGELLEVACATF